MTTLTTELEDRHAVRHWSKCLRCGREWKIRLFEVVQPCASCGLDANKCSFFTFFSDGTVEEDPPK